MNTLTLDMNQMDENDFVFTVPSVWLEGDMGDPLHPQLENFLRGQASIGYWPVDWMEHNDNMNHQGVWFKYNPDIVACRRSTEYFITRRGDV